jgi:molybdopterin converting factor small subunit
MIRVRVKSSGTVNELLDREVYVLGEGATLLELIREVNVRAGGNRFRNAVLSKDESALAPGTLVQRNGKEALKELETTLYDGDSLYIVNLDLAGG